LRADQNSQALSCARWFDQVTTEKPLKNKEFLLKKIESPFFAKKNLVVRKRSAIPR